MSWVENMSESRVTWVEDRCEWKTRRVEDVSQWRARQVEDSINVKQEESNVDFSKERGRFEKSSKAIAYVILNLSEDEYGNDGAKTRREVIVQQMPKLYSSSYGCYLQSLNPFGVVFRRESKNHRGIVQVLWRVSWSKENNAGIHAWSAKIAYRCLRLPHCLHIPTGLGILEHIVNCNSQAHMGIE